MPIPINYVLEQYKDELAFNKEKNQESNSTSQISTTLGGENNSINNINEIKNNIYNSILSKNEGTKNEKKLNLEESIKKGIKDISKQFNSDPLQQCPLTLACFYHCDLILTEQEEYNLNLEINDTVSEFKNKIKIDRNK